MRLLITGACGFVGATLAQGFAEAHPGWSIAGIDNLSRPGAELNVSRLKSFGVTVVHGDVRCASDLESVTDVDWVLDAAAIPSVLAGVAGGTSSRQLAEHNLVATINVVELCRRAGAGLIMLSTSRVYSIPVLAALPVVEHRNAYLLDTSRSLPTGCTPEGITEGFSTAPPLSLYGATKLASEVLALEYGDAFGFPVWVNRCGVMAGAGQFGRPDQGIFAYWINAHLRRLPLCYTGFEGTGFQVRDVLHPLDLMPVLERQLGAPSGKPRLANFGGGETNAMSLRQLTEWCDQRFGPHPVAADATPRRYDVPWVVMDASLARDAWQWRVQRRIADVLDEIARHAEEHTEWLSISMR